jgi:hypothetical protein
MGDKSGSVYYAVDIPDFQKDALSLSGLVIAGNPAPPSGGSPLPETLLAYTPTTRRAFKQVDQMLAFLRIYQHSGGNLQAVQLETTILDEKDKPAFHAEETLAPDRFAASRSVDHELAVPVNTLPPGSYLLSIQASAGKVSLRRDVRFSVK